MLVTWKTFLYTFLAIVWISIYSSGASWCYALFSTKPFDRHWCVLLCSEFFWNQVTFLHCHISNAMHYLPQIYSANEFNSYFSTFVWCANEPKNEHQTGVRKIKKKKKTMEKNTIIPTETNRSDKNISVFDKQYLLAAVSAVHRIFYFDVHLLHQADAHFNPVWWCSLPFQTRSNPTNPPVSQKQISCHAHSRTHTLPLEPPKQELSNCQSTKKIGMDITGYGLACTY